MKLVSNNADFWDKTITIQLSLRELQILFDSLGSTAWISLEDNWKDYHTLLEMPYNMNNKNQLYNELEDLLTKLGGVALG